MSKLIITCLSVVLIFGICVYIFRPAGGQGMGEQIKDGHRRITENVRGFDYITD
ncbi:hypothetical protein [Paenibacillus sp. Pae108]|uniref:Uncharacterized protein n=2 Tax=Paenibacillus TaxID=44249 RepID=A0A0U2VLH7_9BACL|nr:hypothetical protein [Paenibacillus sp. Pae108]ALS21606.1 hypothetical protein IJ22_12300 [Paenibacillus naphthalenovorans]